MASFNENQLYGSAGHFADNVDFEVQRTNHFEVVLDLSKIPNRRDFEISMNMSSIIKKGLMDKKFDVYFQPIYSVKEESFTRAEALLRLYDDKYGEIEPKDFIPEAERNGTIHKIGDIVFDKVCEFIASSDFKKLGLEKIEINLSTVQCMHQDLPIHIMDAVKQDYAAMKNMIYGDYPGFETIIEQLKELEMEVHNL